jgi:hypothetical protein
MTWRLSRPASSSPSISKLVYDNRGLQAVPSEVNRKLTTTELSLSGNPIVDFSSLVTLPCLTSLILDHTRLCSFAGARPQPALKSISFARTPLAKRQTHRLMASIVFSDSLTTVNGRKLTTEELRNGNLIRPLIGDHQTQGWLLQDNDAGFAQIHPPTKGRKEIQLPEGHALLKITVTPPSNNEGSWIGH